jgi:hypothetical protein
MVRQVLPALPDSAEFQIVCLRLGQPQLPNLLDGLADARGRVDAVRHLVQRVHPPSFGRLLVGKRLDMTLAVLVLIVNDICNLIFVWSKTSFANASHC